MAEPPKIDLNIRGENVQELYTWYLEGRLVVNRRYQRKLVWTKEEKAHLIDTMARRFPLPLILLAEIVVDGHPKFEIIDGMQRLNAVFSFIEGKFAFKGQYFDLDTMASSKQMSDEGKLEQRTPTLNRSACAHIANYKIPISTYRIDRPTEVDEIFRRINSFGRILSNQEIRQAGVVGTFADTVRMLSASIRGDVSHEDILVLSTMDKISITNRELDYGINVDDVFWVQHGILIREDIRDSRDEEVIADLVAYVISPEDDKPPSSRQALDSFYGRPKDSTDDERTKASQRKLEMDTLVSRYGENALKQTITQTFDFFAEVFSSAREFRSFLRKVSPNYGTPRYFQAVFLAFHELLYDERLKLVNMDGLLQALTNIDDHIKITTGGNWGAPNRTKNIEVVKGLARRFFKKNPEDPVAQIGRTEFINLLAKSRTEAASYDFKQGLHRLDAQRALDEGAFNGILETVCALANLGRGRVGYVILGVADKKADAERVMALYKLPLVKAGEFFVVGVDREASEFHTSMDKYLQLVSDKISRSDLSDETKIRVASHLSTVDYSGRSCLVIRVDAGTEPCFLGDKMFRRNGAQTVLVPPKEILQVAKLFQL